MINNGNTKVVFNPFPRLFSVYSLMRKNTLTTREEPDISKRAIYNTIFISLIVLKWFEGVLFLVEI